MIENLLTLKVNDYFIATFFWNIFLALIPCVIAWRLSSAYHLKKWGNISPLNKVFFALTFLVWFFFFPNTTYLITDIRHLADYCDNLDYFRVCVNEAWVVPLFFTYAFIGIPTFYYSLKRMNTVVEKLFGKWAKRLFPFFMIPVTALGLLLGLVARFNSWNVITHPWTIIQTASSFLTDMTMQVNLMAYTLMLYFIYYSIDLMLKRLK